MSVAAPRSDQTPAHVAIIMDGNGRWAKARGLSRYAGHRRGLDAVRRAVRSAIEHDIRYLTIYSFSSENWRRPPDEVAMLMGLLKLFIRNDLAELHKNGVRVRIIGGRDALAADIAGLLTEAESLTKNNSGLTLIVAFNYGARQEIVEAAKRLARDVRDGRVDVDAVGEDDFAARLETAEFPDPDLIIRTSGEMRLSNFLLWQTAYAELVFLPVLWPDFDDAAFASALQQYAARERRFGAVARSAVIASAV
jgi:undecaprenyl diphosphate synthase